MRLIATTGYSESPEMMTASENRLNGKTGGFWRGIATVLVVLAIQQTAMTGEASDGYQSYSLRYSQAEQVESALSPLLPAGTEIVADRKGNRILVRGTAAAQELAQRVVASLDKPPSEGPAPAPPPSGQAVLRVYSSAPGKAMEMARQLQDEFGRTPGVRIVADQRTSQVLVLAPPEVQTMLASRLSAPASEARGAAPAQPPAASQAVPASPAAPSAGPETVEQIELSRALAESLEASLTSIFGNRLASLGATGPGAMSYRLRLSDGGEVSFTVDREAGRIRYRASGAAAQAFPTLIRALDHSRQTGAETTRLVPLQSTRAEDARRTVEAIRVSNEGAGHAASQARSDGALDPKKTPLAAQILRPGKRTTARVVADAQSPASATPNAPAPAAGSAGAPKPPAGADEGGLVGPVQIEMLEGLDVLVIRGNARDVKQVVDIIQQIEKLSIETEPAIEVCPIHQVDCSALSTLVSQIYNQVYAPRQGAVTIISLVNPNALLLVGRKENVERARSLIQLLDVPVKPDAQFQVFRLQHAAAATVQSMIEEHYADPSGLAPVVRVTSDVRSNSLIVHGSPRDLAEVAAMISRIDTDEIAAVSEVQVFKLTHTLAADLAQTLNDAIQSQALGMGRLGARAGQAAAVPGVTGVTPGTTGTGMTGLRSSMLQFVTVDAEGKRRLVSSGILADVRITFDSRANTLIVAAPAKSMPLIEALIKQLDQPPAVRALVKVFTIVNGDASTLVQMLNDFFGTTTTGTAGFGAAGAMGALGGAPAIQTAAGEGESSLVPLRFAADPRTNTIVASGTEGDLLVVEAMLLRLDSGDVKERISTVYRLKNAPASDVATAINNFLRSELQALNIQTTGGALLSPFEQIERQVVVVAEPVSNSLLVAATPRYFEEIKRLVEELDKRPPMVLIQVLIAEVDLSDNDEFGVELGLQDGLLFQRGAPPNPGFLFNSATQGNDNTATALQNARFVGGQSLSNFGLGRSTQAGFGGLVLSASSESVSVLIRALKTRQRIDILARPQIQTLDNQTAYINVGQSVPQIRGVTLTQFGQTNNVDYINTGIILGVTPRISPDGIVVMEIDAQRSDVGPESEGIPISVSAAGQIIRSPRINQQLAQTTISATDGQTVVLGGLLSKQITETRRQVPLLGDIPVLGHLFRYDAKVSERRELLIIMTPHVVRTNEDAEAVKRVEAGRMHWCLADVIEMSGDGGLRSRSDEWPDSQTETIYPDGDPRMLRDAPRPPEPAPTPSPEPSRLTPPAAPPKRTPPVGPGT